MQVVISSELVRIVKEEGYYRVEVRNPNTDFWYQAESTHTWFELNESILDEFKETILQVLGKVF